MSFKKLNIYLIHEILSYFEISIKLNSNKMKVTCRYFNQTDKHGDYDVHNFENGYSLRINSLDLFGKWGYKFKKIYWLWKTVYFEFTNEFDKKNNMIQVLKSIKHGLHHLKDKSNQLKYNISIFINEKNIFKDNKQLKTLFDNFEIRKYDDMEHVHFSNIIKNQVDYL